MLLAAVDIYEALLAMVAIATVTMIVLGFRDRTRRNVKEERDELLAENARSRAEITDLKQERDKLEARTDLTTLAGMIERHEKTAAEMIEHHEQRAAERAARAAERDERFLAVLDRIARKLEINGKG